MEPSSTEGGADETLPKSHPPGLVSAAIKQKNIQFFITSTLEHLVIKLLFLKAIKVIGTSISVVIYTRS